MRCAAPGCQRRAEVVVHVDRLAVAACLSCGVRVARALQGRMRLLGDPERAVVEIRPHPRCS